MINPDEIGAALRSSSGSFLPWPEPRPFTLTYRVRGLWRRWRLRRAGWSTEWTVEYDPRDFRPVRDSMPRFTATRGGVSL